MIHGEPRLDEVLQDPIVLAVVRSDGITIDDVIRACERARRAVKRKRGGNRLSSNSS